MFNSKPKGIEKQFLFLLQKGFFLKAIYQVGELELLYSNEIYDIAIFFYDGIKDELKKVACFDIVIINKNYRKNLLECDKIFSKDKLQILKDTLNGLSINSQIDVYAKFLEDNLTLLTPLN